MIWWMV